MSEQDQDYGFETLAIHAEAAQQPQPRLGLGGEAAPLALVEHVRPLADAPVHGLRERGSEQQRDRRGDRVAVLVDDPADEKIWHARAP